MIDWHCHILPGLDDGSESLAESLEMARVFKAAGYAEVHCTPHCIHGLYGTTPGMVRKAVDELQTAIDRAGIELRLQPGMEYFLDEDFPRQLEDPLPLGESRCLLVEAGPQAEPERVREQLFLVRRRGLTPLLAHPERYEFLASGTSQPAKGFFGRWLKRSPEDRRARLDAATLQATGCQLQGNLGSFAGIYGSRVQDKAERLLAAGAFSRFGSDAHRAEGLDKILVRGLSRVA